MSGSAPGAGSRVTVISADTHAGAAIQAYRPYLESRWHGEFDEWAARFESPHRDLQAEGKTRNFDNERRVREQEADGVVAEVVFPNTIPPFFPTGQHIAPPPSDRSYPRRLAGLRAHSRWLRDFCAERPGRRVGLPQLLLNDVDEAIADVRWAAENGFTSVLVPHIPPDCGLPGYYTGDYDPLWAVCADLGIVLTQHGGSGMPSYRGSSATFFLMLMEVPFFAQRSLWHLILSGVFERFGNLRHVMTEQGVTWVRPALDEMDQYWQQMRDHGRVGEFHFAVDELLPRPPSDYFATNCFIGSSFPAPSDAVAIRDLGVDRVMWGSDYPHDEGTYPLTRESLRLSFAGWTNEERRSVLAGTAADVYGFDLGAVDAAAAAVGPTWDELDEPVESVPIHRSPAFNRG